MRLRGGRVRGSGGVAFQVAAISCARPGPPGRGWSVGPHGPVHRHRLHRHQRRHLEVRNSAARPNHPTAKDVREIVAAGYPRPTSAHSHYLGTAANPAPWPTPSEPRRPRGGRRMLGTETPLTGSERATAPTRTAAHPL